MNIKKVILALGTVFALAACGPTANSSSQTPDTGTTQESEPSTQPSESTPETSESTSESGSETHPSVEKFLTSIYGENALYSDIVVVSNNAYPNIKGYYVAKDANGKLIGYVFVLEGKNTFGNIKMSVGINADGGLGRVFLIENGQTNGKDKVVQDEYVDKYNKGEIDFDDVSCGATVGATLINELGRQAQNYVKGEILQLVTDYSPYCKQIFGSEVDYVRRNNVLDATNDTLKEFWTVRDRQTGKTLGRVYHAEANKQHYLIGINKGGEYGEEDPKKPQTFKKFYMVNANAEGTYFINKLNVGAENFEPSDIDSPLIKDIKKVGNQAFDHASKNKITNPLDVTNMLPQIWGEDVSYCEQTMIDDANNPNILEYWNVKDASRNYLGRVYHLEAPGEHGALHVVVGVQPDSTIGAKFYKVATNAFVPSPEHYQGLLKYIAGLNDGSIDINSEDDVACGATGTASGIRQLALIAVNHYGANLIADVYLENIFGNNVSYIDKTSVDSETVREYWDVIDNENSYVGRVYHCALKGKHATIHTLVGVDTVGNFKKMYLINKAPGVYGDKLQAYVNSLNNGDININDDIHNGATASSSGVRDIAKDALEHYKANPILPLLKDMKFIKDLFNEPVTFNDHRLVSEKEFANVVEYWTVKNSEGKPIAGAYHCALPGKHAIMEITVSVYAETVNYQTVAKLGKIILMNKAPNEYGDKLQAYVDSLNKGDLDINDDVHNGATSSSNGVKGMVLQAMEHLKANHLDEGMSVESLLNKVFSDAETFVDEAEVNSLAHDNLLKSWTAKNKSGDILGRVYHGGFPGSHGVLHVLVGINLDGTLKTIYWANTPAHGPEHVIHYGQLAAAWIEKINNGEIKLTDDVHSGASSTTSGIISIAIQALDHYALNPIVA